MFTINQSCIFGKCCCTKTFLGTFISFRTFQLNKQTEGGNNQSHITNEDNVNWSRNQIHYPTLEPGIYLQRSIFWNHQFVIFYNNSPNWSLNLQCRLWRRSLPKAQLLGTDATSLYFLMQDYESFCTLKMSQLCCKGIGHGPLLLTFIEQRECVTITLERVRKAK